MRRDLFSGFICLWILSFNAASALAAVGCTLNDPDRDIKRLFPKSTGYKTEFIVIKDRGGDALMKELAEKLGDALDPTYESATVEHAYYIVLKGTEIIGRVNGLTQKGVFGGMQFIIAYDPDGKILNAYFQKLSSPDAKKFRSEEFTKQFVGLTLEDFYIHKFKKGSQEDRVEKIKNPSQEQIKDYYNTLRAVMRNLIQMDMFYLNRKSDAVYKKLKGGK